MYIYMQSTIGFNPSQCIYIYIFKYIHTSQKCECTLHVCRNARTHLYVRLTCFTNIQKSLASDVWPLGAPGGLGEVEIGEILDLICDADDDLGPLELAVDFGWLLGQKLVGIFGPSSWGQPPFFRVEGWFHAKVSGSLSMTLSRRTGQILESWTQSGTLLGLPLLDIPVGGE